MRVAMKNVSLFGSTCENVYWIQARKTNRQATFIDRGIFINNANHPPL